MMWLRGVTILYKLLDDQFKDVIYTFFRRFLFIFFINPWTSARDFPGFWSTWSTTSRLPLRWPATAGLDGSLPGRHTTLTGPISRSMPDPSGGLSSLPCSASRPAPGDSGPPLSSYAPGKRSCRPGLFSNPWPIIFPKTSLSASARFTVSIQTFLLRGSFCVTLNP